MHQSAHDILAISTTRESILVGTPGAFGVIHADDVSKGRGEIENAVDHMFRMPGIDIVVRSNARRLGLDAGALKRMDRTALRTWVTKQAIRGALCVAVVPEPIITFSSHVDHQQHSVAQAQALRKILEKDDEDEKEGEGDGRPGGQEEALPRTLEARFLIVLDKVAGNLHGEAKKRFLELSDRAGIEMIAVGLLIWMGASFVPGLNLVVVANDLPAMSGHVMRANGNRQRVHRQDARSDEAFRAGLDRQGSGRRDCRPRRQRRTDPPAQSQPDHLFRFETGVRREAALKVFGRLQLRA